MKVAVIGFLAFLVGGLVAILSIYWDTNPGRLTNLFGTLVGCFVAAMGLQALVTTSRLEEEARGRAKADIRRNPRR